MTPRPFAPVTPAASMRCMRQKNRVRRKCPVTSMIPGSGQATSRLGKQRERRLQRFAAQALDTGVMYKKIRTGVSRREDREIIICVDKEASIDLERSTAHGERTSRASNEAGVHGCYEFWSSVRCGCFKRACHAYST